MDLPLRTLALSAWFAAPHLRPRKQGADQGVPPSVQGAGRAAFPGGDRVFPGGSGHKFRAVGGPAGQEPHHRSASARQKNTDTERELGVLV